MIKVIDCAIKKKRASNICGVLGLMFPWTTTMKSTAIDVHLADPWSNVRDNCLKSSDTGTNM